MAALQARHAQHPALRCRGLGRQQRQQPLPLQRRFLSLWRGPAGGAPGAAGLHARTGGHRPGLPSPAEPLQHPAQGDQREPQGIYPPCRACWELAVRTTRRLAGSLACAMCRCAASNTSTACQLPTPYAQPHSPVPIHANTLAHGRTHARTTACTLNCTPLPRTPPCRPGR